MIWVTANVVCCIFKWPRNLQLRIDTRKFPNFPQWGRIIYAYKFEFFSKFYDLKRHFPNLQFNLALTYIIYLRMEGVDDFLCKVEKNLKGNLDSIPSPSPSVKIQIMGRKVCLWCKGKTCNVLLLNLSRP